MSNVLADNHRGLAGRFSEIVEGVTDWDAPTPVREWKARDIVGHLTTWLPGMLGGMGVELPTVSQDQEPEAAWAEHTANVQALLDDESHLDRIVEAEEGQRTLGSVIEQYYLPDIFMHGWDLAKASGQDPQLDEQMVRGVVDGMTPMAEMLKESGQFGEPTVLDESHSYEDRMIALIGRDPQWTRPGE